MSDKFPIVVSTANDINLPYENPAWIYEGYDELLFEDWTGLVLNRPQKQIQENVLYLRNVLSDLSTKVENGVAVLIEKITVLASTTEVPISMQFKDPMVLENGIPQDEVCYSIIPGKVRFGHTLQEGVQLIIQESRRVA